MDKNAIKKYAVWARNELIARVSQKAQQYGITAEGYGDKNADSVNGVLLSATEKKQRQALIAKIDAEGFEQVMEEVAYTWFNRFIALRFMEVNNYLPSHTRVFTNEANEFKPQILADAISLELEGLDMDKVFELKNANQDEKLYKYLLIVQCNALSSILPGMFQKIADYSELLLPDYLLREGSVIEQMVALIPENDWTEQVQIIGWLYQYYISQKKDDVFAALKKNVKISKENIPAATQLFTPDWIVRYMVENSLGRLWMDGHPDDAVKNNWNFYFEEAEQTEDVAVAVKKVKSEKAALRPEDIRCIDPCSGSGHVLSYIFDVLVQIYETYGYTSREAVESIVKNNLYGLDIDERAAQLASFSIMMKARQYDRRFLSRGVSPHIYAVTESNGIDNYTLEYFCNGNPDISRAMDTIVKELRDAREYGSIISVSKQNWELLFSRFDEIDGEISIHRESALALRKLVEVARMLSMKYSVTVTNPPYAAVSGLGNKISDYVKDYYPDTKSDLFAVFIEKCIRLLEIDGYTAMVTPQSWMFLVAFDKLREKILSQYSISSLVHLGTGAFECGFGTAAYVIQNTNIKGYKSCFLDVTIDKDEDAKREHILEKRGVVVNSGDNMRKLPNEVIAYWCSDSFISIYTKQSQIKEKFSLECGIKNGNNALFLRPWFSIDINKMNISDNRHKSLTRLEDGSKKWFKCNKGGGYRKWYGNYEYVIDLEYDARNIKNTVPASTYRLRKKDNYFWDTITWPLVSGTKFSCRFMPNDVLPDVNANIIIIKGMRELCLMGYMNSKVFDTIINMLNPTLAFPIDAIGNAPYLDVINDEVESLVKENIEIAKADWDETEMSWDFAYNPCIKSKGYLRDIILERAKIINERMIRLKNNEERINQLLINAFGLEDELTADVDIETLAITSLDATSEIKKIISYAVGCMFGRYSIGKPGIVFAGGLFEKSQYDSAFCVDEDNIIPICTDEYFEDDIVNRFVDFIKIVYGAEYLEENLSYIADALGGTGSSREIIRKYFNTDFFGDHCNLFSVTGAGKQPIYWLFDSGKKNGFKCLIYMHRYQPDTIARIRTDYVHEQQSRYRTALVDLEQRISGATTSERVKLNKQLKVIQDQAEELRKYEEKIHHLADQMISIDLDDGVKENYAKFQDVLAKIK